MTAKKRGRKRRDDVERGASGKIKTASYLASAERRRIEKAERATRIDRDAAEIARWQRIRQAVSMIADDTRMGTPMGRLLFMKPALISDTEYAAGERLGGIIETYNTVVIGQVNRVEAQDVNGVRGRLLSADLLTDEEMNERVKRIADRYMACEGALAQVTSIALRTSIRDRGGAVAVPAGTTHRVVGADVSRHTKRLVMGEDLGPRELALAIGGLKALAKHWRLDEVPPQAISRWGTKLEAAAGSGRTEYAIKYE